MRDWMKRARIDAGLTMKETAEKIGVSESYYSMIESGNRQKGMDLSLAQKLSEAFGIPMKTILDAELSTS